MNKPASLLILVNLLCAVLLIHGCKKDNNSTVPVLTTYEITRLSHIQGKSGGRVTDAGGLKITSGGVCWSTSPNPTISDFKTVDPYIFTIGLPYGHFLSYLNELTPDTKYYLKAYATTDAGTGYGDEIQLKTLPDYNGQTGTVTDVDGNIYNTVGIGGQLWMEENLKTTCFNDGTPIPEVLSDATWEALATPGYCFYGNDTINKSTYGNLYNWYALDSGSNGNKNVCPSGWHVPSNDDWMILTDYIGVKKIGEWALGIEYKYCSYAGQMLKEVGTEHWKSPNEATNEVGFTALPGGMRYESGMYLDLGVMGGWWSSSKDPFNSGWAYGVSAHNYEDIGFNVDEGSWFNKWGLSIRCVKNQPED